MKVLVIGYQGILAHELHPCLTHAGCAVMGRGRPDVDITQGPSIRRTLADVQPDILINAAAYTAVDKAESEPDVVFAANRDGAGHVAAACRDVGVPLIHVSTYYVLRRLGVSSLQRRGPHRSPRDLWPKQVGRGGGGAFLSPGARHCADGLVVWASPAELRQNYAPFGATAGGAPGGGRPARLPDLESRPG
jgi:hypothetical protein